MDKTVHNNISDREKYETFSMLLPELADNKPIKFFPSLRVDI